jgi:putative mRNA 3-end processing factor
LVGRENREKVKLNLAERAYVTKTGAVLLGDTVACDAFDADRPLRIVTHAHADHLGGLRKSIRCCEKVIMTPATRDLAQIVNPTFKLGNDNVLPLEYNTPLKYCDETSTLLKADHIMGASQVSEKMQAEFESLTAATST